MDIFKIAAIGIITAFTVIVLRENKSEIAMLVGIVGGIIILLNVLDYVSGIFSVIDNIIKKAGIPASLFLVICKIVGIAYISDFSATMIEESGQKALADKVLLAGKLIILVMALPIVTMLFDLISGLVK